MKSILQDKKECFKCLSTKNLESHHILFGSANRKLSEKDGLKVYLCYEHHRGNYGVHFNKELDLKLKRIAQKKWQEYYNKTTEDFIARYGKNYL